MMLEIPPVAKGYKRIWKRCTLCGRVAYYDYLPYCASNPVLTMPCHHYYRYYAVNITETEAMQALEPDEEHGYA